MSNPWYYEVDPKQGAEEAEAEIQFLTDPIVISATGSGYHTIADWLLAEDHWKQFNFTYEDWVDMKVATDEDFFVPEMDEWTDREYYEAEKRGETLLGDYLNEFTIKSEAERKRRLRNAKARFRKWSNR